MVNPRKTQGKYNDFEIKHVAPTVVVFFHPFSLFWLFVSLFIYLILNMFDWTILCHFPIW